MNDTCTTFIITVNSAESALLNDPGVVQELIQTVISLAGCHEINHLVHEFTPQGISMISLLEESHIAIHTWPERGSAYLTLTSCRPASSDLADQLKAAVVAAFLAKIAAITKVVA